MLFGRRDLPDRVAQLTMLGLVMTGTHDLPRPVHEGRRMAEALGYPFVEMPGAGHIASLEAPNFFTAELGVFLERELAK